MAEQHRTRGSGQTPSPAREFVVQPLDPTQILTLEELEELAQYPRSRYGLAILVIKRGDDWVISIPKATAEQLEFVSRYFERSGVRIVWEEIRT